MESEKLPNLTLFHNEHNKKLFIKTHQEENRGNEPI
jgi:hypothetical protein